MTAPASAKAFRWPAPPYFEFVREMDATGRTDCTLTFRDGTRAGGRLQSFLADMPRG